MSSTRRDCFSSHDGTTHAARARPRRNLVGGRHAGFRAARASLETSRRAACLLLARDVRPAGHERSERRHVVARRDGADLLDAGIALAPADRLPRGAAAGYGGWIRLPARLVA